MTPATYDHVCYLSDRIVFAHGHMQRTHYSFEVHACMQSIHADVRELERQVRGHEKEAVVQILLAGARAIAQSAAGLLSERHRVGVEDRQHPSGAVAVGATGAHRRRG